jgi:hypothetical protein
VALIQGDVYEEAVLQFLKSLLSQSSFFDTVCVSLYSLGSV